MSDWKFWDGKSRLKPEELEHWLSQTPPWRRASASEQQLSIDVPQMKEADLRRGQTWRAPDEGEVLRKIHLALWLRRPLLVEGNPGVGKSSLAYALAYGLGLGEVLKWEISSKTPYKDGLYQYDAVSHLRGIQASKKDSSIEKYVTLGPLGTALIGSKGEGKHLLPRVLLIDELDKSDYDLPNDLLHVLEGARFTIEELNREGEGEDEGGREVAISDSDSRVKIRGGHVASSAHPVVVITSNGEREFPPAFLRRCVPLKLKAPRGEQLKELVGNHFNGESYDVPEIGDLDSGDHPPVRVLQTLFLEAMGMNRDEILKSLGGDGKN